MNSLYNTPTYTEKFFISRTYLQVLYCHVLSAKYYMEYQPILVNKTKKKQTHWFKQDICYTPHEQYEEFYTSEEHFIEDLLSL